MKEQNIPSYSCQPFDNQIWGCRGVDLKVCLQSYDLLHRCNSNIKHLPGYEWLKTRSDTMT